MDYRFALAAACVALSSAALGQDHPNAPPSSPQPAVKQEGARQPQDATSSHSINVGGRQLAYRATAGTLPLTGSKGETTANVYYTAYAVEDGSRRPVTFVFNGGPGAASAFLQLGALGPRVVSFNEMGSAAIEPVRLRDNPDTWLDVTDLVFVDPVATGYSRAVGLDDEGKDRFFGVEKDADAMTEFIRLYLTRTSRTLDPVFLAGESYGGFRVAMLTRRLLQAGFDLRGAVLISPVVDFSLIRGGALSLLPAALTLPSVALAHLETKEGPHADLAGRAREVEAFARGRYLTFLAAGSRPDPEINNLVTRYTGLPLEEVQRLNGRVSVGDFAEHLRRSRQRGLSLYDGSVSIDLPRPGRDHHGDPILDYAVSVLEPAFAAYVRGELGYATDLRYRLLNRSVGSRWDYGVNSPRQGFAGALADLEEARTQRPALRLMFVSGYTDLVTPFAAAQYLVDHMHPIEGAVPVDVKVYPGGHMMYFRSPSRQALARDARALVTGALPN